LTLNQLLINNNPALVDSDADTHDVHHPMTRFLSTSLLTIVFAARLLATEPKTTETPKPEYQVLLDAARDARLRYDKNRVQMAGEEARLRYVTDLTTIAYRYMSIGKGEAWVHLQAGWEALNREIVRYAAPKDSSSHAFSRLLVGKWESPRHDYVYYANGKWSMLPIEEGVTSGNWHIEGNQYFDGETPYTIILLNEKFFVFTNGPEGAYFEKRITK
jgi:hypothetical protein